MKIDRLFAITNILIQKKTVTAAELAQEFGVSVRTIYRDMDILSSCGIPIFTEKGRNGGISVMDHYTLSKTLLTDEEQNQIIMALQSVNVTGNVEVKDALRKLGNIFQKNIESWIEVDFSEWGKSEEDKEIFYIIRDCILSAQAVTFWYYNGRGEETKRIVEPLKVVFKSMSWYLYGYCRKRKDFRFFKLSRIKNLEVLTDTFDTKIPEEVSFQYKNKFSNIIRLKLKIDRSMGFRVFDEFRSGIITEEKEYFLVDIGLPRSQWLYSYLLGFGETLTVLEPEEIRIEMIDIIKRIEKNYI
ncbi:helix-turn-helix transcriptional regulator [Anaerosacchariphilus polymeriproducens]|uniref:YafY family transcriptional regulator n=1 Tax=Anaerosacchariphilus polymeriproducens TaxID=1812858 RepID=A0A371AR13_9FIRM|nr:YafY family protein [Anaerosacchariphilus polymeriproducens]RDU22026.1 YafY family transcriptional regulator [Anaerosacchariphilus polymeriproducens]